MVRGFQFIRIAINHDWFTTFRLRTNTRAQTFQIAFGSNDKLALSVLTPFFVRVFRLATAAADAVMNDDAVRTDAKSRDVLCQ